METKAIFLDVDGTLVSFDTHRVPQSAIEALQQVHESGIKIIIATGRAFTDLHELEEIPYDAVIALNGSDCVLRDGTPISRKQIPEKDFQRVLVLAQHYGFALAIETNKGIFVNELNPTVIELARLVNHPTPPVADIEKEFMGGECCQLCIYCDEEMEKVYNWTVEVPEWARPTVQKLLDKGYLQGNDKGELELTYSMLKLLVINDRAGLYD